MDIYADESWLAQVHGALFACAYELAAFGNMTWCNVFNQDEIENFEYEWELLFLYKPSPIFTLDLETTFY